MTVIDLALKDIKQILRDWKSALFLVIMPILFTVFFGLVFTGNNHASQKSDPRLAVGWLNLDSGGLLSASLESLLANSEVIRPVVVSRDAVDQVNQRVAKGELAAVLRVPSGYSQAILTGEPARLEIITDENTPSGRTAFTALDTIAVRLLGAVESANISVQAYQDQIGFINEASRQTYFQASFQQAVNAWKEPPLTVQLAQANGKPYSTGQEAEANGFTQSSAGMLVQFAMFGLINSSMILVLERKTRCLQRLLTTPVKRAEVIAGHILAMVLVVLAQETILVLLGQYAFGVNYLREPGSVLLMMVALAIWAASLGLLIGAIAKREDQVIVLCLIVMFVFSALGGSWFPLDVAGKAFSTVGHVLPSAWAMDGFQNIVLRGLGFSSVVLPAGLLMAYSLAFFGLALWRFKFE
jgi:ABC-2 type transport system permease protein